jgi:uncharacterized protein (TIGR02246 family)
MEQIMPTDEDKIRAVIQDWHDRTARGDVDGVLALMADDATFLVAGKPAFSGKAAFEKGLRAVLANGRIESSARVEHVLVSGDLACATTQLTVKMIPHDGSVVASRHGPTLTVFCRSHSGAWLLERDANLLVDDAAAASKPKGQ